MTPHAALAHVLQATDTIFDPAERAREAQALLASMGYVLVSTRAAAGLIDRARGSHLMLVAGHGSPAAASMQGKDAPASRGEG